MTDISMQLNRRTRQRVRSGDYPRNEQVVGSIPTGGSTNSQLDGLAGHSSSRTPEVVYRHELRPVIITGAEVMDKMFR